MEENKGGFIYILLKPCRKMSEIKFVETKNIYNSVFTC